MEPITGEWPHKKHPPGYAFWASSEAQAVPEAERNHKGRMHSGKGAMPSIMANSGVAPSAIRCYTGHRKQQIAEEYIECSREMRGAIGAPAFKRLRSSITITSSAEGVDDLFKD